MTEKTRKKAPTAKVSIPTTLAVAPAISVASGPALFAIFTNPSQWNWVLLKCHHEWN